MVRLVASPRRTFGSACAAFTAVALHASLGQCEPPGLELRWSAPAECPTQPEVLRTVEQLLAGASAVPMRADARVDKRKHGFVLALDWSTSEASATRVLEGESCQELAQAAALMLSLAAEPTATRSSVIEAPRAAPAGSPAPSAEAERALPREPSAISAPMVTPATARPDATPRVSWSARAGAAVDAGSLPRATVGVLGGAGIALGAPRLRLDALVFAPKEEENAFGSGRFLLGAASLAPCYRVSLGPTTLEPCLAAELHALPSRGFRLRSEDERVALLVRVGAGIELDLGLTRDLGFFFGIWGSWAPARPRFVVDGKSVFRPAAVAARGSLGFEYEF